MKAGRTTMRAWASAAAFLLLAAIGSPLQASTAAESRVQLKLDVSGDLFGPAGRDAQTDRQPIEVAARFDFRETPAPADAADAAAVVTRTYFEATAEIRVDGQQSVTSLPADARRLAVALLGTTPSPFLPDAFLSRGEFDLLETPFDPLLLDQLVTREAVAVDDTWRIPADAAAGLLAIDTIETGELEAKLVAVADGVAQVALAGVIDGAADGVPTHVIVEGTFTTAARGENERYTLDAGVASVSGLLRERRQASHVAPGFEVEARLELKRSPADDETAAAADEPADPPTAMPRRRGAGRPGVLWHRDPAGRYDLVHDARWRTVEENDEGVVMRLVDHGALVAQCSIAALPRANADVTPGIAEMRRDIERSLAGQLGRIEEATESTRDGADGDGLKIIRVASSGTAEGLPFHWIHYVVADAEGRRASVTFMLEASMRKRFDAADRALIEGFEFVPLTAKEARLPRKTSVP